jgi:hypothetical protein
MVQGNLSNFRELKSMPPAHAQLFLNGSLLGTIYHGYQQFTVIVKEKKKEQ